MRLLDPRQVGRQNVNAMSMGKAPVMSKTGNMGGNNIDVSGALSAIGQGLLGGTDKSLLESATRYIAEAPQRRQQAEQYSMQKQAYEADMADRAYARARQERQDVAYQGMLSEMPDDDPNKKYFRALDSGTGLKLLGELWKPQDEWKPVSNLHGKGGWGMQSSSGDVKDYKYPPEPGTTTIEGVPYYTSGDQKGEKVLPGVKTQDEKFMEMMGGGPEISAGTDGSLLSAGTDAPSIPLDIDPSQPVSAQPSAREIFDSLPYQTRMGIWAAPNKAKAFSQELLKSKGLDIQFNGDGTISSITQGGSEYGYGKKQTGNIEEKLFNTREGLARLNGIEQAFRPEFQEIGTRFAAAWAEGMDFMGIDLSPEDTKLVEDFSSYQMQSLDNMNKHIKDATGSQMSENEAGRIRKGMPDPGENWWNGDSPVKFESKMKAQIKLLRAAAARYQYALKNGWDMDPNALEKSMPLDDVGALIDDRGAALEREFRARNPNLSDDAVSGFVVQQLNAEFGIGGQ